MKVSIKIFACMLLLGFACSYPKDRYLVDTIRVVIFGEEETDIITESDLKRPSLEGAMRSKDDIILERLIYLDAKKFKVLPDEEAINRHLQAVQREHNLTLDQLKQIFKNAGYTYEEGRQQFAIMTTINSMLDLKIRSRLIVPERDITKYYNEHPERQEASYFIEKAFVPFSSQESKQSLKKKLTAFAKHEGPYTEISWSEPFWINDSDLADDKKFIALLSVDQISMPQETDGGFELLRLKEKRDERLKPLEERYQEISSVLRQPRYEQLFNEYKKELFDNASIVYFD